MDEKLLNELSALTDDEKKILNGEDVEVLHYSTTIPITLDMSQFLSEDKMITAHVHGRFTDTGLHQHNYIEIAYMCKGSTTHMINGKQELVLKTGELLLMNQHALHYVKRAEENDVSVNIIINPKFFDAALEMAGVSDVLLEFLLNDIKTKSDGVSYLHFCVADEPTVQSAVEALISTLYYDKGDNNLKKLALSLVLAQLMHNTHTLESSKDDSSNTLVTKMLWAIETDYRRANLNDIARDNCVSVSNASKIIKKCTGKSFKEHLIARRLSKASDMLITTNMPIYDICIMTGYDNVSYFYRLFEGKYGCTPAEYRKNNKTNS